MALSIKRPYDYNKFNSENYGVLGDGNFVMRDEFEGDYPDYDFYETLAISQRNSISPSPVALINKTANLYQGMDVYPEYVEFEYKPVVIFYDSKVRDLSFRGGSLPSIKESRREEITAKSNNYWEGVFQYDINRDGNIPDYRPSEYPAFPEPDKYVKGKTIKGTNQNDNLKGKKKDDYIDGKNGNDILSGKKGNDILIGKKGFDQLYGQAGDDFLNGGEGDDLLEGGQGADVFKISKGTDKITDFNVNEGDKIAIPAEYINDFVISTGSGDASVEVDGYGKIVIAGLDPETIGPINSEIFFRYI